MGCGASAPTRDMCRAQSAPPPAANQTESETSVQHHQLTSRDGAVTTEPLQTLALHLHVGTGSPSLSTVQFAHHQQENSCDVMPVVPPQSHHMPRNTKVAQRSTTCVEDKSVSETTDATAIFAAWQHVFGLPSDPRPAAERQARRFPHPSSQSLDDTFGLLDGELARDEQNASGTTTAVVDDQFSVASASRVWTLHDTVPIGVSPGVLSANRIDESNPSELDFFVYSAAASTAAT